MKKFIFYLGFLALLISFSSCQKEGVYTPKDKISRVYYVNNEGLKTIEQEWTWDKNILSKIVFNPGSDPAYFFFKYDGKRLIEITSNYSNYSVSCKYTYDGAYIKKMDIYDNSILEATYTFVHDGKHIEKIEYEYYDYDKKCERMLQTAMLFALPQSIAQNIADQTIANHVHETSNSKEIERGIIYLEWNGNNVSKVRDAYGIEESVYTYTYDDAKNPLRGCWGLFDENPEDLASQNNVLTENHSDSYNTTYYDYDDYYNVYEIQITATSSSNYNYNYIYDHKVPVEAHCTKTYSTTYSPSGYYENSSSTSYSTTIYEYVD